jgi:glycerol-3-phosphate dehydrogenase
MIPETSDGRVLFIVPWHGKLLMGTTDTPVHNISLEPVALESEIDFILATASTYLTTAPTRKDILSIFAGLRPLAAPVHESGDTKEISRSHKILVSESGLFSIIGGKWTTYRKMGEDMINKIEKELNWKQTTTCTASLHIHGFSTETSETDPLYYYGSDEIFIKELMKTNANECISEKLSISKAQVVWAVRHEMARTVEDFLSRRTRALLLDAKESVQMASRVAHIMADELKQDERWQEEQVNNFIAVAKNYLIHA